MKTEKIYAYEAIASCIKDHGIDTMFGLMGDANLFMVDDYVRKHKGTFVPVAYEGSAVLMALSYSKFSHSVGVATVTHGPGFTNCITALVEGVRGNVPMVLLCGDTPVLNPENLQNIDQRELVKATGAGFMPIRSPETIAQDIAKAFNRASIEKRPIVLNMPADFMWQEVEYVKTILTVFDDPVLVTEGKNFEDAIGIIASAKRPIVLAGGGAIGADQKLINLANRLEAPLATTLRAKAMFNDHPYNLDIFGTLSTPSTYETIDKSDCIIAFGASLHHFTTDHGALLKGKRVVVINNKIEDISKNYQPDSALIGDVGLTADNIVHWLNEAEIQPSGFTNELDSELLTKHPITKSKSSPKGTINFCEALEKLEDVLPKDRVLVTDGGRFMTEVWCRISAPNAESFISSTSFGSIGLGLQFAIGAGFSITDKPIVLFTGDGGFMMGGINEFNTAVRLNQDLITIVCNDSAYGAEHIQFIDRDMDPSLAQFEWPSFANVATSLGGHGIEVSSIQQLETALKMIRERTKPILIELKLDPNDVPRMRT